MSACTTWEVRTGGRDSVGRVLAEALFPFGEVEGLYRDESSTLH